MELLSRTVTPFRLCACGCGASVHGKARLDTAACRQRVSRQARAARATGPKQFNLVIQHEIRVTIPTVLHSKPPAAVSEQSSAPECDHEYGFLSLNGPTSKVVCDECNQDTVWFIPTPPEVAGYVSAIWKDWERKFPNRYPMKVRSQFPPEDVEISALPIKNLHERTLALYRAMRAAGIPVDDELMENPTRFHCLADDANPKGIRLGDLVDVATSFNGRPAEWRGYVTRCEDASHARAYAGGYMVQVTALAGWAGFVGIADVEKVTPHQNILAVTATPPPSS